MITIHVVKYQTPEGNQWEYRTATITDAPRTTTEIRETADRQAAETDPALAFVSHDLNTPGDAAAVEDAPVDPLPEEPTA